MFQSSIWSYSSLFFFKSSRTGYQWHFTWSRRAISPIPHLLLLTRRSRRRTEKARPPETMLSLPFPHSLRIPCPSDQTPCQASHDRQGKTQKKSYMVPECHSFQAVCCLITHNNMMLHLILIRWLNRNLLYIKYWQLEYRIRDGERTCEAKVHK